MRALPEPAPPWPVGDPTSSAWREQALARVYELRMIARWCARHSNEEPEQADDLLEAIYKHLETAGEAAQRGDNAWTRFWAGWSGSEVERTMTHLDAAEAAILRLAPAHYVRGQLPALRALAADHLPKSDESHAMLASLAAGDGQVSGVERDNVVAIVRRSNAKARGEITRVRSFRNVLVAATVVLAVAAIGTGIFGWSAPDRLSVCFNPDDNGRVVCPTGEAPVEEGAQVEQVFDDTASAWDVVVIELVGLLAAAIAAARAISGISGTSTPYSLPVAQALLKLPLGALTALLGLLLMRGEFVPGLTALDTPAQIIAWAVVFGYAQQVFSRLVDQQAQSVLNGVGTASESTSGAPAT